MKRSIVFLSLPITLLAGCSSTPVEPAPTEVAPKSRPTFSMSSRELLSQGKKLYSAKLYSVAREYFQQLKDSAPSGPYAEFAEIKSADCSFMQGEASLAAAQFEDFAKHHPSSRMRPYALMMAAESHRAAYAGLGRDPASLEKALAQLEQLSHSSMKQSVYEKRARELQREIVDALAAHEQFVARFYDRQQRERAAEARRAYASRRWEPVSVALAEALPETTNAMAAEEILFSPGPDSAAAAFASGTPLSTTAEIVVPSESRAQYRPDARHSVRGVQCSSSPQREVTITFNEEITDKTSFASLKNIEATGSDLAFVLPDSRSEPLSLDCFGKGDLLVESDGRVRVTGIKSVSGLVLSYPPRLLLRVNG